MALKGSAQICPQCGVYTPAGQLFCGGCGQELIFCNLCGAANLAWSDFCHNCGKLVSSKTAEFLGKPTPPVMQPAVVVAKEDLVKPIQSLEYPQIERMRICDSCKKVIGDGELFCSYCGAKQTILRPYREAILDPHAMKVALTMLSRVTDAKEHPEYSIIDQLTTMIGEVALGKGKPQDAQELSFSDQLRLLTLVFEFSRDKVGYKGETFGEHVRWPWETVKTGGDCDCKVVLLASMLACLGFRRMYFMILPAGKYVDIKQRIEKKMQGHALLEVELSDRGRLVLVRLDPSCPDCDVDEISESIEAFLQCFYRIPIVA